MFIPCLFVLWVFSMFLHLIDRKTAIEFGLKKFFTGEKCNLGGVSERSTKNSACRCKYHLDIKRLNSKKRYVNKKDDIRQQQKQYSEMNKAKMNDASLRYYSRNKEKINSRKKIHRLKNIDSIKSKALEYRNRNKEKIAKKDKERYDRLKFLGLLKEKRAKYYSENREAILNKNRGFQKTWRQANKDKLREAKQKRRAAKLQATPSWYSELDSFVFTEAYLLSKDREILTGIKWEIDHMIPLQAENVCGLHVWNNFQVIPSFLNQSKRNKMIYCNPFDWLREILDGCTC